MRLFEEFPPVTSEAWRAIVEKDLKGADFDKKLVKKTLDGIGIRPYYRREDVSTDPGMPGAWPYRRSEGSWKVREAIREDDAASANGHALRALSRGAQEIAFHTFPIGATPLDGDGMRRLLEGIYLDLVGTHFLAGPLAAPNLALFVAEAQRLGYDIAKLHGSIDHDPIMDAVAGWTTSPLEKWPRLAVPVVRWMTQNTPSLKCLSIRGGFMEKAGASVAQELALVLALYSEYLAALRDNGLDLEAVSRQTEIKLAVGSAYFLEISKLRAARMLLANLLQSYGVQGVPAIHVETTTSNKTLYDPHVNLLRATTEAMAAVIGGCDSLSVATFDQAYTTPDEFGEHLARNTEMLLSEEAFMAKVADPLGGSYAVESLTEAIAEAAWEKFLAIEQAGGFVAAVQAGLVQTWIEDSKAKRAALASSRRRTIVGTSIYANAKERRLDDWQPKPLAYRARPWTEAAPDIEGLLAKTGGAFDLATEEPAPKTFFSAHRPSQPFEDLRLATERFVRGGGKQPLVYLAMNGDGAMRRARAGFVAGFFPVAGYTVIESSVVNDLDAQAKEALDQHADFVVLCSSDDEYAALAQPMKEALRRAGSSAQLWVAGYPEAAVESLKADGVEAFVSIRSDLVATFRATHAHLGIPV